MVKLFALFEPHPAQLSKTARRERPPFFKWTSCAAAYAKDLPRSHVRWYENRAQWRWMTQTIHATVSPTSCKSWHTALERLRARVRWEASQNEDLRWWTLQDVQDLEPKLLPWVARGESLSVSLPLSSPCADPGPGHFVADPF